MMDALDVSLNQVLFSEKKTRALDLLQMIDAGILPQADGTTVKLIDVDRSVLEEALRVDPGTVTRDGSFAQAFINYDGSGSAECVIKLSRRYENTDASWKYLRRSQKLGGKSYATPLPDVYYFNPNIKLVNETVILCVVEHVETLINLKGAESRRRGADLPGLVHAGIVRYAETGALPQKALELAGWSAQDLQRFVEVLQAVMQTTNALELRTALDINRDNMGIRPSDNTVCVFDPVYG